MAGEFCLKNEKGKPLDSRAGWYDHASNQLNNLPTLDVAPELVGYGASTADLLESLATGLKDSSTKIKYVRYNSLASVYGPVYGNRRVGFVPTDRVVNELKEQAADARRALWDRVEEATAQLRRQMTQKFNVQF